MNRVTVAVYCHNYNKRLCWMLSSIADQILRPVVDIGWMAEGTPAMTDVLKEFSHLEIKSRKYDSPSYFSQRGWVRSDQTADCDTQWILYADCDMVYSPRFFHQLNEELDSFKQNAITVSGRMSCDDSEIPGFNAIVDDTITDAVYVPETYSKAFNIATRRRRSIGAGFFQLCPTTITGGYYVKRRCDKDWTTGQRWDTKSDIEFRRRIGATSKCSRWFAFNQVHLNHARDLQVNMHLEDAR